VTHTLKVTHMAVERLTPGWAKIGVTQKWRDAKMA
jgi:hypothetical protein